MHRTTLYLPQELYVRLRLLARETRSTVSDLMRLAAESRYRDDFAEVSAGPARGKDSARLTALSEELRQKHLARDRRFRWNRRSRE